MKCGGNCHKEVPGCGGAPLFLASAWITYQLVAIYDAAWYTFLYGVVPYRRFLSGGSTVGNSAATAPLDKVHEGDHDSSDIIASESG